MPPPVLHHLLLLLLLPSFNPRRPKYATIIFSKSVNTNCHFFTLFFLFIFLSFIVLYSLYTHTKTLTSNNFSRFFFSSFSENGRKTSISLNSAREHSFVILWGILYVHIFQHTKEPFFFHQLKEKTF